MQRVTLLPLSAGETLGQQALWLSNVLEIKSTTVRSFLTLLERCFLLAELPSWTVGVSARAGRRSKLHPVDTGLAGASLPADARKLSRLCFGGAFVESFVVSELRKQAALIDEPLTFAHFRDHSGVEVDLILERPDGWVIDIEVKSSAVPERNDAPGVSQFVPLLIAARTMGPPRQPPQGS